MPELPEVETIRRDLNAELLGKKITKVIVRKRRIIQGKSVPYFTKKLTGQTVAEVQRRAKLLMVRFKEPDLYLLFHLKMTGQLLWQSPKKELIAGGHSTSDAIEDLPNKHTHVIFELSDGARLFFNDMRQFGYLKLVDSTERDKVVAAYGLEPLTPKFTKENFSVAIKKRKTSIKQVLLDQTIIAGLGNIYADEVCFAAGIRPTRRANSLKKDELDVLHQQIQRVIRLAIKQRGTTFNNYRDAKGRKGSFVRLLKVYGRGGELCLKCGQALCRIRLAGRGTVYCAQCQK